MGFISSLFSHEISTSCAFQSMTQTFTNGEMSSPSWSTILTVNCLFWTGSAADNIVSEKIRAEVDGVIVMDYEALTVTIPENARVSIGSDYYSVVYVENSGNQNQMYVIPVKRIK